MRFGPQPARSAFAGAVRWLSVLVGASALTFVLMDWLPGDAATIIARTSDAGRIEQVRADLGLDRPLAVRLAEWASALVLHGDGGSLFSSGAPVWEAAAVPARNSAILVAFALPSLILLGVVTGAVAGARPGSARDGAVSTGAQTTLAVPEFALATLLLVVLAGLLRVAPAVSLVPPGGTPLDRPAALIVPVLGIALTGGAWLQRMVRAAVVDASLRPHVRAAALAGMHPAAVMFRHTLSAAAGPIAQACAATVPYAVTGTVVIENVVGYPGAGTLVAGLVSARETVAVSSLVVIFAAITVAAFAVAERMSGLGDEVNDRRARR